MTEATGQSNQASPSNEKAPWERAWNDVKNGLSIIGEAVSDTFVPKDPPQESPPWERTWGTSNPPSKRGK